MEVLGLIPARGGSKRIKDKNIKPLSGKPLIAYTIEAAKKANLINRIIVSTDSEKIREVCLSYGAEVPFLRPAEISRDDSKEIDFYLHALSWLKGNENYIPDLIVCLYPTAPFRKPESIDRAVELMIKHPEADSLRSVRLCSEHPYKMWVESNGYLRPFIASPDKNTHTLSYQQLPKVYIQNANIYITRPSTIFEKGSPVGDVVLPFVMDEIESIDINTYLDFLLAEMIIRMGVD